MKKCLKEEEKPNTKNEKRRKRREREYIQTKIITVKGKRERTRR